MKRIFLLLILCSSYALIKAQKISPWQQVNEVAFKTENLFQGNYKPSSYKLFKLDEASIKTVLSQAPSEEKVASAQSALTISVPDADGQIKQFSVVESSVMQPALAAKYPEIKSYAGQGINDPSSIIRFDMSPSGFHGMILSASKKTIYINPVDEVNKLYAVYYRENASQTEMGFKCLINENLNKQASSAAPEQITNADDDKLRTYRLALVATGEFSQYFLNGREADDKEKKAKVLTSLITDLTRADAIFERDLGLRLLLVDDEDELIFLNPKTDPYHAEFNSTTQTVCDLLIGEKHYDIGHVVHKDANNGNAGCIGCVCQSGAKGSGFTMFTKPDLTDPFVVDYWIHEMGHQLGANHTFTFSDEGTIASLEPGSGSTIMGYAGITGATDVQQHSDAYFHAISIQQIMSYIKPGSNGARCVSVTPKYNHPPTANAGKDYTIPKSTPFALTGRASDRNGADLLTYCWEQFDLYKFPTSSAFPKPSSKTGPLFRSAPPSIVPVRYFPDLSTILSGELKNKWEALPSIKRSLHFRLTVRDNHYTGGSNESGNTSIAVTDLAGPFSVAAPDAAVTLAAGDITVVRWKVAKTNLAPVNCRRVNILLSQNGGSSFPVVLASNTENDGEEKITIPDIKSKRCRIKVEAADNIFFDISDADFVIEAPSQQQQIMAGELNYTTPKTSVYPNPAHAVLNVTSNSAAPATITIYDAYGKNVITKQISAGSSQIDIKKLAPGAYMLTIYQRDGKLINTSKFVKE